MGRGLTMGLHDVTDPTYGGLTDWVGSQDFWGRPRPEGVCSRRSQDGESRGAPWLTASAEAMGADARSLGPGSPPEPIDLQRLYAELESSGRSDGPGGLGARSVRMAHQVMHLSLETAAELGLIVRSPAEAKLSP